MQGRINYDQFFSQALQRIKAVRDPHATRPETVDLQWDIVEKQVLFDFAGKEYKTYRHITAEAQNISISYLNAMIMYLLKEYEFDCNQVKLGLSGEGLANCCFTIVDRTNDTLLLFKTIEESSFWKTKDKEPDEIEMAMKSCKVHECKYIYLMHDYAYLQVVGHNDDSNDPGRGYNVYSLKWFFETYFGRDEYVHFCSCLKTYSANVQSYLGYIFIKTLTPNALVNFRKIVENRICNHPYDQLLRIPLKQFVLDSPEYKKIRDQFLETNVWETLVGTRDFAESLITAEWLYNSMKKAYAIDLTVIGMGYFKAVEQLLCDLICLHKGEERLIRKDYSFKNLPDLLLLNQENIDANAIDFTLGSMANFYKENMDMLRDDISFRAKKYIRESIFDYVKLRNGYFHKDNIHDFSVIDNIRSATYNLVFLLLGSHKLTAENKQDLGLLPDELRDDYAKLCEFVNYHAGGTFFLCNGDREYIMIGLADVHQKIKNGICTQYSGAYFTVLAGNGEKYVVQPDNLPEEIFIGKIQFEQTEKISYIPVKTKKIFSHGKFIGNSLGEENDWDY